MEIITMNKNIIRIGTLLLAALSFSLVACNRILDEVETVTVENGTGDVTEVLTLLNEPQTKATLGNEDPNPVKAWENGDLIGVWAGANATSGEFQNCSVLGGTITVNLYGGTFERYNYAVYPYKYSEEGSVIPSYNAGALTLNLPATYAYSEVGGTKNPVPMVAKNLSSEGSDLTFYTVGALARISVSGIPFNANKLVVSFDKTVTGGFTVQNLSSLGNSNAPYIAIDPESSASTVTVTLTPGADYIGAAINIPIPQGTVNVISVAVYEGEELLMTVGSNESKVIANWPAARAHGKKAIVAYTPSIGSMFISPGKLYTDESGTLKIADNWYTHTYVLSGATDDETGHAVDIKVNSFGYDNSEAYSIFNRTHFNWNEMYHMFHNTAGFPSWSLASTDSESGSEARRYPMSKTIGGVDWRVPSCDDAALWTYGRAGARLNENRGVRYIKLYVTDVYDETYNSIKYGATYYNAEKGTTSGSAGNWMHPNFDYQAGVLFFPDNVEIEGGYFTTLSSNSINKLDAKYVSTSITKPQLDLLITKGCAFFPALGHWTPTINTDTGDYYRMNGVGSYGIYWLDSSYIDEGGEIVNKARAFGFTNTSLNEESGEAMTKNLKNDYESIRLVRDIN